VKSTRAARNALHNESRVLINQNRHKNQESRKIGNNLEAKNPWKAAKFPALKLTRCPRSLAATLAALPSISEIPFPRFLFS
jgi:hypothetical protein